MQKKPKPRTKAKTRILESAIVLFARHGIDGATIRAIAKHARVTPMTLYRSFENKDKLIQATLLLVIGRHFESSQLLTALYADPAKKDLSDLLLTALLRWYDSLTAPATKLMINAYTSDEEKWRCIGAQVIEELTKILTTFIDRDLQTRSRGTVAGRTAARTLLTVLLHLKMTSPELKSGKQHKKTREEVGEVLRFCLIGLHSR